MLRHDFNVYSDNSIINKKIHDHSLSTISYAPGTSPLWFVSTLLSVATTNTAKGINNSLTPAQGRATVVSFSNPKDVFQTGCKSVGTPSFEYIDCFSNLFQRVIDEHSVRKLFSEIESKVNGVVIVDGVEILQLATSISSTVLTELLQDLQKHCEQMFIVLPQPVSESEQLMYNLLIRSHLVIHFKPLDTGRAKDITGSVSICRGPVDGGVEVCEQEWVYFLTSTELKLSLR